MIGSGARLLERYHEPALQPPPVLPPVGVVQVRVTSPLTLLSLYTSFVPTASDSTSNELDVAPAGTFAIAVDLPLSVGSIVWSFVSSAPTKLPLFSFA